MYKTVVYTLVNGVITHQKQQMSKKWYYKAAVKRVFGVHSRYLPDYMDEQMWRSSHPHSGTIIFRYIMPHFTMERVHRGWIGNFSGGRPRRPGVQKY